MKCKHLILVLFLSLPMTGLLAQTITGLNVPSASGLPTTDINFNLTGMPCTAASSAYTGTPCTPGLIDSTAFFILYGDGTFGSGEGQAISRMHHYQMAGTYTATAWFAGKKHGSPPPAYQTTITTGSIPGSYTNPTGFMPGNVKITTSWLPVSGQPHFIILTVDNKSTAPQSGTITFYFNSNQILISASDYSAYNPGSFFNSAGISNFSASPASIYDRKWTWDYSNLPPNAQRHIFLLANVSNALSKGTPLRYKASNSNAYGDNLSGSTSIPSLKLSGFPHDPNRKEVNHKRICAFSPEVQLEYYISFQNDGETYADNVLVLDELDASLDASSIDLIEWSHDCIPPNVPPGGNVAPFDFQNIKLPGLNQLDPHQFAYSETIGEFTFSVLTQPNLPPGIIPNVADIHFIPLPPIQTNYANVFIDESTEDNPCVIEEEHFRGNNTVRADLPVVISPNPCSEHLLIHFAPLGADESAQLEILGLSGQIMLRKDLKGNTQFDIPTADWPSGIYFARIQTADDIKVVRFVKQ